MEVVQGQVEAMARAVAGRDIARGAFCCKELIEAGKNKAIKEALMKGMGRTKLDPRYGRAICTAIAEFATSRGKSDATRVAAARALVTCMKATQHDAPDVMQINDVVVGANDGLRRAMAASQVERAVDLVDAHARVMGVASAVAHATRSALALRCDASALEALVQSGLAVRVTPDCAPGVRALLTACVRAAFITDDPVEVCVNPGVERALHKGLGTPAKRVKAEPEELPSEPGTVALDLKMGVLWTFVKSDPAALELPVAREEPVAHEVPVALRSQQCLRYPQVPQGPKAVARTLKLPAPEPPQFRVIKGVNHEDVPSDKSVRVSRLQQF